MFYQNKKFVLQNQKMAFNYTNVFCKRKTLVFKSRMVLFN